MTNPTATLSAGVMKRLAEDMGWTMYYNKAITTHGREQWIIERANRHSDGWRLTDAGHWEVACFMQIWPALVRPSVTSEKQSFTCGQFRCATPEEAFCAAITDMYGEGDE